MFMFKQLDKKSERTLKEIGEESIRIEPTDDKYDIRIIDMLVRRGFLEDCTDYSHNYSKTLDFRYVKPTYEAIEYNRLKREAQWNHLKEELYRSVPIIISVVSLIISLNG